ncbi:hypothetical protein [Endozoicomonas numazuensis]|uniref:Uncharacterized protein n=1 Tax=Endozoicomonas numazuensis TaxID=1137799 RepID=A0A081N6M0_9GAMM|nr:hypothetical protein [Endozoicomonas numazuensis]KEQ14093.1 hypothetical protein GZ78_26075 [Endozoicomonas numazuensis]
MRFVTDRHPILSAIMVTSRKVQEEFVAEQVDLLDRATGRVISQGWNQLDQELKDELNGLLKISSVSPLGRLGALGSSISAPTKVALEGGRHSGQLKQFMKQTPEQLRKTIQSFDRQIEKHQTWIKSPETKVKNFQELRPEHRSNLIHHWQQDIERHKELKAIAHDALKGQEG